jgi:TatD DNase family protein
MLFDTHVNLHGEAFTADLKAVIGRARSAGVTRMITICDRLESLPAIRRLASLHPDIWRTAGVHPHHAKDFLELDPETLATEASDPRMVGVGECGLDQHYGYSGLDEQVRCFRTHIEAAQVTQLPLVVHTREADELTGDMLEESSARRPFPVLLHCYTGGMRLAQRATEFGAYFSVSGILTFKAAQAVRDVIATLPLDRIILETDCPYLAPIPHRGRRNEPAYLVEVCKAFASLRGLSFDEAARLTTQNALRLFGRVR